MARLEQDGCFAIGLNAEWAGRKVRGSLSLVQDGCVHRAALEALGGLPGAPASGSLRLQPEPKKKFRDGERTPEPPVRACTRGLQRAPSAGHGAAVRMP